MTKAAWALHERMSDISEICYCAGWLGGNEFTLWKALSEKSDTAYGVGKITLDDKNDLRKLSKEAGGWIWTGEKDEYTPQLLSFSEWQNVLEKNA